MARSTTYESLWRARELIDAQYAQPLDLDELARTANFSRYHFLRAFRHAFHATPHEYLTRKRIERAKELLAQSDFTVTEICFEVAFESLGSFSSLFHKIVGWSPSVYRARAWEQRHVPLKFIPNCYVIMITNLSLTNIGVLYQNKAYGVYVNKLGFKVKTDMKMDGGFRWLTISA